MRVAMPLSVVLLGAAALTGRSDGAGHHRSDEAAGLVPSPFELTASFDGLAFTGASKPDPQVAAGPDTLVLTGDWSVTLLDKNGSVLDSATFADFFRPAPASNTGGFNPRTLFDPQSGRFFIVSTDFVDRPCTPGECIANLLLAVSKASRPESLGADDWHFYALDATLDGTVPTANLADLPMIGMNESVVVISSSMIEINENKATYAKLRILEKARLINGEPAPWTDLVEMLEPQQGGAAFAWQLVPAPSEGNDTLFFLTIDFTSRCSFTVWGLDDALTSPKLSTQVVSVPGICASPPPPRQPGGAKPFDWTFNGIFGGVARRGSSLWTAQSIERNGVAAIRWVEIDVSGWPDSVRILQDSTFGEDGVSFFCPAIMVDARNNALIAFARSGTSEFASFYYAGRLGSDPPNTFRPSALMKAGTTALVTSDPSPQHSGQNRYGDYFGIALDPVDGSFWLHGEYANAPEAWGAWVGNVSVRPGVSLTDLIIAEGNAGTKDAVFEVSLSFAPVSTATVEYATLDATAKAGSDYEAVSGQVTFAPGERMQTVRVPVIGDRVHEGNETFLLSLSNPQHAIIDDEQGLAAIVDDDEAGPPLGFNAANYSVRESAGKAVVTVRPTAPLEGTVTVRYTTSSGSAEAGPDYAAASGILTFRPGVTMQTFAVSVIPDTLAEGEETVLLQLSDPTDGAQLGSAGTAVLTIIDDDLAGRVQFASATVRVAESAASATITVKRLGGLASPVRVDYAAAPGTAESPGDFGAVTGTLTFAARGPAATTQTFSVPLGPDDGLAEGAETVLLTLSPRDGAALGAPGTATLVIEDTESTLEFERATYTVKESAPMVLLTVRRTGAPGATVSVDYGSSDAGATQGADYRPVSGTLTFSPRVFRRTFAVPILKDSLVEGPEGVSLTLSNARGPVTLGHLNFATLTIADDDSPPIVQFFPASYTVDETIPRVTLSVRRTGNLALPVTVGHAVTGGAATNGGDYHLDPRTLTFKPGVTLGTISFPLMNDTEVEGSETVIVTLSSASAAVIGTANPAVVTILDNEPTVQLVSGAIVASEAATQARILVRRTGSLASAAAVDFAARVGTAEMDDFAPVRGTLTFAPGDSTETFTVALSPDTVDEPNETVVLELNKPVNAGLGTPSLATLTITDDDVAGTVRFGAPSYSVREDGSEATITVARTGGSSSEARVDYVISDGSAREEEEDYAARRSTLVFAQNESTKTFTVEVRDDGRVEGNETVVLTLENPDGGLVLGSPNAATLWIVDDDADVGSGEIHRLPRRHRPPEGSPASGSAALSPRSRGLSFGRPPSRP